MADKKYTKESELNRLLKILNKSPIYKHRDYDAYSIIKS